MSIERAINVEFIYILILILLIVHSRTAIYKHNSELDSVFSMTFLGCKEELISKQPILCPVQIHLFFLYTSAP